jgi:hypothetical protein
MPLIGSVEYRNAWAPPLPVTNVSGLQKTVNGVTYTLIVAHRAFNYPSTPYPGPSDIFFRNMFTTGYNTKSLNYQIFGHSQIQIIM